MTPQEAAAVLAKAQAYDRRTVGEADILAWQEALADVDLADALAAVTAHYRESTDWLMPAHVLRIAAHLTRERHRVERETRERHAVEVDRAGRDGRDPVRDRSAAVTDMLATLRDRLGPSDPTVLRRPEWVREERQRQRAADAAQNPHYQGPPPPGGWPIPGQEPDCERAAS